MTDELMENIPYNSFLGSVWFVYYGMVMGEVDVDSFNQDGGDKYHLYLLFLVSSFIMIVVLLNMLIAIMGNTFAERMPLSAQITIADRLRFVLDHWHLKHQVQKDFKNYNVAAFTSDFEQDDQVTMQGI